ncbi:hypothetical protein [Cobetia sp. ICG0124]|uniref:hypothetical protein n=1 Tax=Cobetia sp. ICG0124 TaxID=2053669 RepID=UPI000FD9926B|nr:hypothetical protein [Cobetia sp. ICG0124]AZV30263.1 hypothetical protein CU110_00990 [Cobetia sp. ICG0124]
MKSKHSPRRSGLRRIHLPVLLSGGLLVVTLPVLADSDTLLQLPTTQSVGVTPNVLLVLDDSGSMSFEDTFEGGEYEQGYNLIYKKVNYANWFTYYRSRLSVGKAAGLELLSGIEYRTGFITINPGASTSRKVEVDNIFDSIIQYVTNVLGAVVELVTNSDSGNKHLEEIRDAIVESEIIPSNASP